MVNITITRILLNQHMNSYNIKLVLSSLKQTPNSVRVLVKARRAMEALVAPTAVAAMAIMETAHLLLLHL